MTIDLVGFLVIATVVIVTPGQDTALTIRNTLAGGRAAGIATAIGVAGGQLVWTVAASVGLTALLLASEPLFNAVELIGAAYLILLGVQALLASFRSDVGPENGHGGRDRRLPPATAGRQGLLSNLSNAKMAAFFTSLLPQFVPDGQGALVAMLGLGLVFATMTLVWLSSYAIVVARADAFIRRSAVRRTLDAVLGTVLIALGVRVGLAER